MQHVCLRVMQCIDRWACRMREQQEREAIDASWREEAEEVPTAVCLPHSAHTSGLTSVLVIVGGEEARRGGSQKARSEPARKAGTCACKVCPFVVAHPSDASVLCRKEQHCIAWMLRIEQSKPNGTRWAERRSTA